jgi:hypothetical protein
MQSGARKHENCGWYRRRSITVSYSIEIYQTPRDRTGQECAEKLVH